MHGRESIESEQAVITIFDGAVGHCRHERRWSDDGRLVQGSAAAQEWRWFRRQFGWIHD